MNTKIKFGTDGWRAIIAKDYTVENVARVAEATAEWLKKNYDKPTIIVGHDCRFAGELFAETVAKVMAHHGIKTFLAKGFVSTPMISLGCIEFETSVGVIITASHNPPSYNGYKLKGSYGGPLMPEQVQEVEDLIKDKSTIDLENINMEEMHESGMIEHVDLETLYVKKIEANFDLEAIKNSGLRFAFDAMYGSGQNVMKRILPATIFMHAEYNPGFGGIAPEPIHRNLKEFSDMIKLSGNIDCGLVTDGDADRLGLYDNKGHFIDSHHIILLLIHYLVKYKKMTGKVVTAFSTTPRVKKMAEHYGLESEVVKIGFKYICGIMLKEDVLVGGEESGGIAVKGHIPERDGIWVGLMLWEFMAKSGKTLEELIKEVYEISGEFSFERVDLHINEKIKQKVLEHCRNGSYETFGNFKVDRIEDLDGYKYYFTNGDWLMIRASGTEPVLRTYAESSTSEKAFDILSAAKKEFMNGNS
ncbi:MAG: phosphoglucomutase/phosphomannomutase family protein [Bacteroidia bacterium]